MLYEVITGPGVDTIYGTPDDDLTFFDTSGFGSIDPEGLSFNPATGFLYIADGLTASVFTIDPGLDTVLGSGDDVVTSFDISVYGMLDPEGIAYDADNDLLYVSYNFV